VSGFSWIVDVVVFACRERKYMKTRGLYQAGRLDVNAWRRE
jgi:hypothetical protein